ncbi:MAG: thioredoxin family protein [Cyanobacteria bacterium SZAS TMP-1]|nr:thioredoxin family protein [Cyanobacteria bacterium SZAS TMP-1]
MRKKLWQYSALSVLLGLSCINGAWARPEGFSDYSFEEAQSRAQASKKFLLIDFMATWCPPCKRMEEETWPNPSVQSWIKENAIAVQFDVDKAEKVAAAFKIEAMPTIVLFTPESGAKEFGRQVGGLDPSELLQWLEGAKRGKSAGDLQTAQTAANEIWPHFTGARDLLNAKNYGQALKEYLWVWNNVPSTDNEHADLRDKLLPVETRQLIAAYPEAKQKFSELRDAAEKAGNRHDWIILNSMLGDEARTLTWFDKAKTDAKQKSDILNNSNFLEPLLFAKCRWADAADYLYPEPLKKINEYYKMAEAMKKPSPDTEVAKDFDPLPSMVLLVYGAYIGAGREAQAQKIADECYRLDDTPAMHQALQNFATAMRQAVAVRGKATK